MDKEISIGKLINFITDNYDFNETKFPALKGANDEAKLKFAINHLALHTAKTTGKIVGVVENSDHQTEINLDEIKEHLPSALINTLRLAELVGMTEDEIIKAIEQKYNKEI